MEDMFTEYECLEFMFCYMEDMFNEDECLEFMEATWKICLLKMDV